MIYWALSLVLYTISFPPFSVPYLIFFAFVPVLLVVGRYTYRRVFTLFFVWGVVFNTIHVHWILHLQVPAGIERLLIVGLLAMVVYLSIFYGLIGIGFKYGMERSPFFLPAFWVLVEFARSYGDLGFPWSPLWESLLRNLTMYQISRFLGPFGVSFFIILTNVLFALSVLRSKKIYLITGILLFTTLEFLGFSIKRQPLNIEGSVKVAIFQPNVLPRYQDNPEEWQETFEAYSELNNSFEGDPDLIVFSESSLPGYYRLSRNAKKVVSEILSKHRSYILLGTADYEIVSKNSYKLYNAALLISPDGAIINRFYKTHLVPFGEWLPFEDKIPLLRKINVGQGDYTPGKDLRPLTIKCSRAGILICFESIFPEISRKETYFGANILINITNDGWFGRSLGPVEHFYLAIFRAIENQRFLVRAAKTGISAIISPDGKVLKKLPQFKRGVIVSDVPLISGETFFTKHGNWMVTVSLLMALLLVAYNSAKKITRHGG